MRSHDGNNTRTSGSASGVSSPSPRNIVHPISRSPKINKHEIWEETKEKLNVSQDPPGLAGTSPANTKFGAVTGLRSLAKKLNSPPKILRS